MTGFFSRLFGPAGSGLRPREAKAAVPAPISSAASPGSMFAAQFYTAQEISPYNAYQLYMSVAPLTKVIDLIADQVAALEPQIKVGGEITKDTPLAALLKAPGRNRDRRSMVRELVVQLLVTGTAYPVAYGNRDIGDIFMIDVVKSQFVKPIQSSFDMWPDNYWYTQGARSQTFYRDPSNPRDFSWFDTTGLAQIYPIYEQDGQYPGVGLSRLNSIKADVELRMKGIVHNASVLNNGARFSGVASYKGELTPDQVAEATAQFNSLGAGAQNAGKILVTQGGELDFTQLSQNMKDMDFSNLLKHVEDAIASAYRVPVTLFRTEAQTNNNYATAWETFYWHAVLPVYETVYGGLARMFSARAGVEIEITHDALTSPVLARAASQRARELYNSHLISRNEAREMIGFEPVLGGDTIYGSIGDVPQAEDYFTNHGINDPSADNSREAYHEARPETNPANQAGAEESARAAAQAAHASPDKKPAAKKPEPEKTKKAMGELLAFADGLKTYRPQTADPKRTKKVA